MVGIFVHFAYWIVLGNVNPLQIERNIKKQMYVNLYELQMNFEQHSASNSIWILLEMPLLLICIKSVTECLLKYSYPHFFKVGPHEQNPVSQIALDKIYYLADQMFDPTNFYSRIPLLDSDFGSEQTIRGSYLERKFIRKRLYATSPFMDLIISNP